MRLPEVIEIRRVRPEPGDTLLVTVDRPISRSAVDRLAAQLRQAFAPECRIVVVEPGLTIEIEPPASAVPAQLAGQLSIEDVLP